MKQLIQQLENFTEVLSTLDKFISKLDSLLSVKQTKNKKQTKSN